MNPLITASEMTFGGFRCEACRYVERWPQTAIDRKLILHHKGRPCPKCHAPLLTYKEAAALLRALRAQQLLNVIKLPIMILLLPVTVASEILSF